MIISLTGPSGAGKEHLKTALLQRFGHLKELCWTTTRPLRQGEIQGVTRESIARNEFEELKHAGEFMFVQDVFNQFYGIRKQFLRINSGHFLTEFHINNLITAHSQELNPVAIGLVPQSLEFLRKRLERRGTESVDQITERLISAKNEVAAIYQHRYLFSLLVEFTGANEHTVVDTVSAFLEPQVKL